MVCIVGYLEKIISLFMFHSSVLGSLSGKASILIVFSFGQSVTKCQNVSFVSPHNLHVGSIVGSALCCM